MTLKEQLFEELTNLQLWLWNAGQHAVYMILFIIGLLVFGFPILLVYLSRKRKQKSFPEE